MEDKIILKFKTKNILNFYEIEPWYWHFVCTEPSFSTWRDILQKSAFTS